MLVLTKDNLEANIKLTFSMQRLRGIEGNKWSIQHLDKFIGSSEKASDKKQAKASTSLRCEPRFFS